MIKYSVKFWVLVFCIAVFNDCAKEENFTSLMKISITDAPIDAENIKSINFVFTEIEIKKDDEWISLQYFQDPLNIDVHALTDGKSTALIYEYISPGTYSEMRITMNVINPSKSLILYPKSNIEFTDGKSSLLYWSNEGPTQFTFNIDVTVEPRAFTDIVLDFDLRKSIRIKDQKYMLNPIVRIVNAAKTGTIEAIISESPSKRVLAYVYKKGTFSDDEAMPQNDEIIPFKNAIASTQIKNDDVAGKINIAFLEPGEYELIFVTYSETGSVLKVLEKRVDVTVKIGQSDKLKINLS